MKEANSKRQFTHISVILDKKLKASPWAKQVQISLILDFVQKLFKKNWGQAIEKQVRVISLKNKVLYIRCENAIIAQEIYLHEAKFVSQIIEKFGSVVKKIKIAH